MMIHVYSKKITNNVVQINHLQRRTEHYEATCYARRHVVHIKHRNLILVYRLCLQLIHR